MASSTLAATETPDSSALAVANESYNLLKRAKNPGQSTEADGEHDERMVATMDEGKSIKVVSANVHAMRPRAEIIKSWDADIIAVQETKLAPHAIGEVSKIIKDDDWIISHGKPCQQQGPRKNTSRTHAATEATSGGVAILTKTPKRPIIKDLAKEEPILHDSGRWTEVKVPITGGAKILTVASFYGISGASSDDRKKALNENLITAAVKRALLAGNEPYLLCGDFNIEPEASPAIAAAVELGLIIDIGHEWAPVTDVEDDELRRKKPDPTYSTTEPEPCMEGKGVTRIDLVLANPTAAASVTGHFSRWDLVLERHVPQEVHLNLALLNSLEMSQKTRGNVKAKTKKENGQNEQEDDSDEECDMETTYAKARTRYGNEFQDALAAADVDNAHIIWNKMAEFAIETSKGHEGDQVFEEIEKAPWRGKPPEFVQKRKAASVNHDGDPVNHKQKEIHNLKNKLTDIRARLKRVRDRKKRSSEETDCSNGKEESTKDNCFQNSLDFVDHMLNCAEERFEQLIGPCRPKTNEAANDDNDNDRNSSDDPSNSTQASTLGNCKADSRRWRRGATYDEIYVGGEPELQTIERDLTQVDYMFKACCCQLERIATSRGIDRRRDKRLLAQWDWDKNYGRRAFTNSRTDYRPPTSTIADPQDKDRYIADNSEIHDQFLKTWQKVYRAHSGTKDIWENFDSKFGRHIPCAHFVDAEYTAQEFVDQLDRMRNTSAGLDGWTRDALRALPLEAWEDRARIENLAMKKGTLPQAYLHVLNPMLPKGQAVHPDHHRGITIFSMIHRVVYGALWQKLKVWQEDWIDQDQHGGRIGGEHLVDAWDLQANIERTEAEGNSLVGALLDYEKFFDRFHPDLIRGLLERSGLPAGIAAQLHFLYSDLRRYIRVAGTYGAVVHQTNGIGQGCSLSIIIANLYVATLFRYLRDLFPGIEIGAFLDDRNITTDSVESMTKVLNAVKEFDKVAGHNTNLTKSFVFASNQSTRDNLRKHKILGGETKITTTANMVGHDITTRKGRHATTISLRANKAGNRATKVANMTDLTRKQKTRLITNAVIPTATSGTLWNIPTKKALSKLNADIIRAIWGKGRKLRAAEMVLAIVNDPTKTDPLSAIVFKRLSDARRLMRKNADRMHSAIHTFELLSAKESVLSTGPLGPDEAADQGESNDQDSIHSKTQGPVAGMIQAAALLGGKLSHNEEGFYVKFPNNDNHLYINKGADSTWKQRARECITNAITNQLNSRLIDPETSTLTSGTKKKGRKDLYGITNAIDTFATTALLNNKSTATVQKHEKALKKAGLAIDTNRFAKDPITNQRLQSVIVGSLRGPDRLLEAGLIECSKCKYCEEEKATLEHLVWECPHWNDTRAPFFQALQNYVDDNMDGDEGRQQRLLHIARLPCYRNCGVVLESDYFRNGGAKKPAAQQDSEVRNVFLQDLSDRQQHSLTRDDEGRIVAYTDGAACNLEDHRRRRASWGVYYAFEHDYNQRDAVRGDLQTVYRAELTAVAHVLAIATPPTRIVSDCLSVVNELNELLQGKKHNGKGDHADLWKVIQEEVESKEEDYYRIEWITSHIEVQKAEEVEMAGGFLARHIYGNCQADLQAKAALALHPID